MGSIPSIIADLKFSRSLLVESIAGLSQREMSEIPIYEEGTIKDVLAHVVGWDQRVFNILPLILQDKANEVPGVEVEEHNRRSMKAWQDKPLSNLLIAFETIYQQILDIIAKMDHIQVDLRHERNGRIITIRSYVLDVMMEHERSHALEIQQWRKELEQTIDPQAIRTTLSERRTNFMSLLNKFDEATVVAPGTIGTWSVKDMVGHLVDWEVRMLKAAQHIFDPSKPTVPPVSGLDDTEDWNEILAFRREAEPWPKGYQELLDVQAETDAFIDQLKPSDWRLRGPYPWPKDQGTLAELIDQISEHYEDHSPNLANLVGAS